MRSALMYHQMLVAPHVGGAARIAMTLHGHAVDTRGAVSRIHLPGGGDAERFAAAAGFRFATYDLQRLASRRTFESLAEGIGLRRRFGWARAGVVHIHNPVVYALVRPFLAASRLKTILHVHLDYSAEQLRWPLRIPPDLTIVCARYMSAAVSEVLEEKDRRKILVLPNAIEVERFRKASRTEARVRLGVSPDESLLMVIANLSPHKGQETAIRALAELASTRRAVRLCIAGGERAENGGYTEKLRSLAGSLGVQDKVQFLGFREDVPELLAAADFLLLPSKSEGMPLSILEAQASGAIVLAAPTAGIPEIVSHAETGFLIDADDWKGYATSISAILDDAELRLRISHCALQYVSRSHEMGGYCNRILMEYDNLLSVKREN